MQHDQARLRDDDRRGGRRTVKKLAVILLAAGSASAGGLQRPNGISARGTGMGGAWNVWADDATAVYFNPAALDNAEEEVEIGGEYVYGPRTYTPILDDGTKGPAQKTTVASPLPVLGVIGRLTNDDQPSRFTIGGAIYNSYGGNSRTRQPARPPSTRRKTPSSRPPSARASGCRTGSHSALLCGSASACRRACSTSASPQLGGDPDPLPAHVLVLQPPGGLHHDPAVDGRDQRGRSGASRASPLFGYQFVVWCSIAIAAIGFLVWGHHMFVGGPIALRQPRFLVPELPRRRPVGDQGVQLDRHPSRRLDPVRRANALCVRLHRAVHDRRPHRPVPRRASDRRARHRHLLRGGPFSLHHGRWRGDGVLRRAPLLVAEDHRAALPRNIGRGSRRCSPSSAST